tara:strand:+ start:138 stop:527 length:390 start_codon:yes stop_codon:yes gene_type:complete
MEKFALFILILLILIVMLACYLLVKMNAAMRIKKEKEGVDPKTIKFEMPEIKISDIFKVVGKVIYFLVRLALGLVFLWFIIFVIIPVGFNESKKYLDERGDRKAICAERIETVENEVAAKKLFETCMDR